MSSIVCSFAIELRAKFHKPNVHGQVADMVFRRF
jgi:hypothetical protein